MAFTIISPTRVEVDGKDAGSLYDFIIANPAKGPEIKQALALWHDSHVQANADLDQRRDTTIAALKAECDSRVAALEADLAILGTPEQAEAKRKAAEIDKMQAEFSALGHRLRQMKGEDLKPEDMPSMTSAPESKV